MVQAKSDFELFLDISIELTGFSESELTGTGMLNTYYNNILQNTAKVDVKYFFENVKAILNAPDRTSESTAEAITIQLIPISNYGGLAKNIIMLWYTGNQFDMTLPNPGFPVPNIVNAESYKQGLMWTAGHAHPPGAKQPGFGSWANLPVTVK